MKVGGIQAIFFDWHGVLENGSFRQMREDFVAKYPENESLGDSIQIIGRKYAIGEMSPEEFWSSLAAMTSKEGVAKVHSRRFQHDPNKALWAKIPELASKYALFILSDCSEDKAAFVRDHYDLSLFTDTFFSYQFKKTKTDPSFFADVLETAGESASSACMVDDSARKLEVAKEVGMETILFKSAEDIKSLLS